jgi:uncharacterized protein YceH (UPF0502 family)
MLPQDLTSIQVRVLGSLIEKELATPDNYPLSLNALTGACNQSTNRDPVMTLDENSVSAAIDVLRRLGLVRSFQGIGSRVPKFQHLLTEACELSRPELAAICVLMLRGAQTLAEVRTRSARLLPNDDADAIEAALEALSERDPAPAVTRLARRPGQKEVRYTHLLGGELAVVDTEIGPDSVESPRRADRLSEIEDAVRDLRTDVVGLRAELAEFRKQFE